VINHKELAICRRRGHDGGAYEGWTQCKWCGIWLREVRKMEEREDEPPEEEIDVRVRVQRNLNQAMSGLDRLKGGPKSGSAPPSKKPRRRS
jgi:hypothetical protein